MNVHNSKTERICFALVDDGEMYYGQLQEILEFSYLSFKVVLFRVKWFDTSNEGRKGTRKANYVGGRKAGPDSISLPRTRNLGVNKITDDKGPVPIRFEWDDKKTMMPLGGHASHWSNYLGELIREMPLYYQSWQKVPAERKAAIVTKIGTQFDLTPHMQSQRWADINAGI
ncbi:hypothetical protein Tco_0830028 [Tanacetum coccineum]